MRKVSLVFAGALLGATAMSVVQEPGLFTKAWAAANADTYRSLNLFGDVFERIRADYVEKPDDSKLIETAINGMLAGLDPHSSYMDAKRYRDRQVDIRGEFGGLGIEVSMENNLVKVVSPIDDTPAARAGILANDIITHIDGDPIEGLTLQQAVEKMRGPVNTPIVLKIMRKDSEPLEVKLVRDLIRIQVVKHRTEGTDVGYIRLASFSEQTAEGMQKAIEDIHSKIQDKDLKGYVIDLRNNPGGLLDQSIQVVDTVLERGEVVSTRGRQPEDVQRYSARSGDLTNGKPIIVLINGGSASASEIVSGALQDHKRATILGTRSFGKGSVQTLITMGNNGALSLTTARYYTPCGRSIQAKGIEPDIMVEPVIPDELKGKDRTQGEAGLRGHLLGTGEKPRQADPVSQDEISNDDKDKDKGGGSSAYVPPDPKDDVQLQKALELLRGTATDATFPPKPGELSAECAQMAKKSDAGSKAPKKVAN
ncbi:S41 family peptidase [Flaviflagellibacter deserti]|uniref:S41 family peptidase n=1 Tax=Flaviflagellibacter deserti TaxID=2267266 RepID=A0ABV9Z858_9HYPH